MKGLSKEGFSLPTIKPEDLLNDDRADIYSEELFSEWYENKKEEYYSLYKSNPDFHKSNTNLNAEFQKQLHSEIKKWQYFLSKDILSKVADVRLLALGIVSSKVKRWISLVENSQNIKLKKQEDEYRNYIFSIREKLPKELKSGKLDLFDGKVTNTYQNKDSFTLEIRKPYWEKDDFQKIDFIGYRIMNLPDRKSFIGAECLEEEVELLDNGNILYKLLLSKCADFIIEFQNIRIY